MECPVCNHPGLPDYQSVPCVCTHCGSDLKGLLLISQVVQESEAKHKRLKFLFAVVSLVLLILLMGSVFFRPGISTHKTDTPGLQKDSLDYYKKLVLELKQESNLKPATADIYYILKKNDNLSKIAKLFYNDGSLTKQIMIDNNLQKGYNLLPGDTLIIKIKTR
jgi:hypothetical protein